MNMNKMSNENQNTLALKADLMIVSFLSQIQHPHNLCFLCQYPVFSFSVRYKIRITINV